MISNEELVEYAEALKDFCAYEMEDCEDCPFHKYGGGCAVGVPGDWAIQRMRLNLNSEGQQWKRKNWTKSQKIMLNG